MRRLSPLTPTAHSISIRTARCAKFCPVTPVGQPATSCSKEVAIKSRVSRKKERRRSPFQPLAQRALRAHRGQGGISHRRRCRAAAAAPRCARDRAPVADAGGERRARAPFRRCPRAGVLRPVDAAGGCDQGAGRNPGDRLREARLRSRFRWLGAHRFMAGRRGDRSPMAGAPARTCGGLSGRAGHARGFPIHETPDVGRRRFRRGGRRRLNEGRPHQPFRPAVANIPVVPGQELRDIEAERHLLDFFDLFVGLLTCTS